MLSIKINPDYFTTRRIPTTTPVNMLLHIPASFTAFTTVFPTATSQDRAVGGMKVTSSALTVNDSAICRLAPNERDTILNDIANLVAAKLVTCYDTVANSYRSSSDIFAFANSGSWGSLPAGTALLAENNLSDIEDPVAAATNLGLGASTTKSFTQVAAAFAIAADTPDNIAVTSNIAITLGTSYLAKKLSVVSTVSCFQQHAF